MPSQGRDARSLEEMTIDNTTDARTALYDTAAASEPDDVTGRLHSHVAQAGLRNELESYAEAMSWIALRAVTQVAAERRISIEAAIDVVVDGEV